MKPGDTVILKDWNDIDHNIFPYTDEEMKPYSGLEVTIIEVFEDGDGTEDCFVIWEDDLEYTFSPKWIDRYVY